MPGQKNYPVKRGKEYFFDVEKLAFGGAGVARMDNYVVFIKGALPGDKVLARIGKRKASHAEARLLQIEKASPIRIPAPCKHFEYCGGCTWQSMNYKDQLIQKESIVRESIERLAGLDGGMVKPVLPADAEFGYRNKMEFSFAEKRWLTPEEFDQPDISKEFALGLHVPGTFDKILHIEHCLLQSDAANRVLEYVSRYTLEKGIKPYGLRSHEGFLRFLMLRESHHQKKIMVNIVTGYKDPQILQPLAELIMKNIPEVSGVVNNINTRLAQIAQGEEEILLAGKPFIEDKIADLSFRISANSFFQTNTAQAGKLYEIALKYAQLKDYMDVWDLYCGTGTISLFLAPHVQRVTGFELVESAVLDARENAVVHGVKNTLFVAGDVRGNMLKPSRRPDVIITDPPRAGMHEEVVRTMLEIAPRRIVYISCNPTTLARDLKILAQKYEVDEIQPVDMFPQTYHIENVAKLTLKNKLVPGPNSH